MASSPLSPSGKLRKTNMFDFDDELETEILSDEYRGGSAKGFLGSDIGKQMLDSFLALDDDETSVKISAPLYSEELEQDLGKVKISELKGSNFSVKYASSDKKIDSESLENIENTSVSSPELTSSVLKPSDAIRELFLRKDVWIGQFRKLSEKRELLQLALKTYNYDDVIYPVFSNLKHTLAPQLLFETLNLYPQSKGVYYKFLKKKGLEDELVITMHACKDFEKCGILRMSQARKHADPYKQALMMKDCIEYFKKSGLDELAEFALDESELLEAQLSIHTYEKSVGMSQDSVGGIEIFSPVLRTPNYTTLYYLCLRHFDSNTGMSSPANFQARFNLSNKEFLWIAVSARAQLKDWGSVDTTLKKFQTKSFFGLGKSSTSIIPPESILGIFHEKDPTPWGERGNELRDSLIVSLLNLTQDLEERYSLALKYLCHSVVIETLVKLKDRARLEEYVCKVPAFSKYRKLIGDHLASKSIP